jgi:ATP-binding cassette subfamily B protein
MKTEMTLRGGVLQLFRMILTEKYLFIFSLALMCLTSVAKILDPLVIAHIIDHSVPAGDMRDMFFWGIAFAIIIILSGFLNYLQVIFMAKLGLKIITKLKFQVFNHLLFLPVAWFDKTPVGVLISRVESDCERIKDLFSHFSVAIMGNVLFFIGMLIVLLHKQWQITVILLIPLVFVLAIAIIIIRYLTKYYKKSRELNADIMGRLTEYIQGISIVQLFNQQLKAENYINEKSKQKQRLDTKAQFIEYSAWGLNDFLISTVFIIIIVLALAPKIIEGTMSIGSLIIFIQYSGRLVWPMLQISENLNQFQRAFVSMRRVFGLLSESTESSISNAITEPDAKVNDSIEFKNVWFRYAARDFTDESDARAEIADRESEWVLRDVSFKIKRGSKVAFVGASGSGKTTCMSLLCRFYDIQKGQILVDGGDLYSHNLHEWRSQIGLILQDIILFPGNLLENIRIFNDDIPVEKVLSSLQITHADSLLQRMNGELHSVISERGQNLSMGERQLISFARAVCFDPDIIIMDEATASIDARTENEIHQTLDSVLTGKTAIIVAHKLASVVDCDEIFLFDNGQILARGTHEQLLETSAEYQKLVHLQFLKK